MQKASCALHIQYCSSKNYQSPAWVIALQPTVKMCYRQNHGRYVAACRYRAAHARPGIATIGWWVFSDYLWTRAFVGCCILALSRLKTLVLPRQLASLNSPSHFRLDGYKFTITLRDYSSHELSVSTGSCCATVNLIFGVCRGTSGCDEPKRPTIAQL